MTKECNIINGELESLIIAIGGVQADNPGLFVCGLLTEDISMGCKRRLKVIRNLLIPPLLNYQANQEEIKENKMLAADEIAAELDKLKNEVVTIIIPNPVDFDMIFDFKSKNIYPEEFIGKHICEMYTPL